MYARKPPWPWIVAYGVVAASMSVHDLVGADAVSAVVEVCTDVVVTSAMIAMLWLIGSARLDPTELRRSPRRSWRIRRGPDAVPWARIQAVALTGDAWSARPTVWTDTGQEIALDELAGGRWTRRWAERTTERIAKQWRLRRGAEWVAAPWAGAGPPWSWRPGERSGEAGRRRLPPARTALVAWTVLIVGSVAVRLLFAIPHNGHDWVDCGQLLFAELVVGGLLVGPVVGPLGLASGGRHVSWARVQAVELRGRRLVRPVLSLDDGTHVSLWNQAVVGGLGRSGARRTTARIQGLWITHRGPQWHPVAAPPAVR